MPDHEGKWRLESATRSTTEAAQNMPYCLQRLISRSQLPSKLVSNIDGRIGIVNFEQAVGATPVATISVSGLVDYIKATLEDDPTLRRVWVVGEDFPAANNHSKRTVFLP